MINIPINANVECTDGPCGQTTGIIVNPVTESITHVVVKEAWLPHTQYMVPIDQIANTTSQLIQLDCTKQAFRQLEPFIGTQFIRTQQPTPYYGWDTVMTWPYNIPADVELPVEYERISPDELTVRRGAYVQATDGLVGQVDQLLVDPKSGKITHLVVREGHLWTQKALTLPLSTVDQADQDNVYLNLDQRAVRSLPAVPMKLHREVTDVELIILTFKAAGQADKVLQALKKLVKANAVKVLNVAVLAKDDEGQVSFKETEDVGKKEGAVFGAITGGLIGLLGGPVGAIVGAAVGAATGRTAAKWIDMGMPDEYLKELQEKLQPGSSSLVILVEQKEAANVTTALTASESQLLNECSKLNFHFQI